MTTANKITILRILVVPFFATQALYYADTGDDRFRLAAILAFWIAAILDGVDGYIARRYNQRSELGAILDPAADKMLLLSGLIILTLNNEPHLYSIPLWCTATILGRDVILLGGLGIIYYIKGKIKMGPRLISKVATFLQMALILHTLLKWPQNIQLIWAWGAAGCTAISCILYILDGARQISDHPASTADPEQ